MKPLTERQIRLLDFLGQAEEQALAPSLREIGAAFGWSAIGTVQGHVRSLVEKGCLAHRSRQARSLRLTPLGRLALAQGGAGGAPVHGTLAATAQDMMDILSPSLRARAYGKGARLWQEGDHADRLVVVEEGRLRAFRNLPDGRTIPMLHFGPGEVLGFAPFFDEGGYPASVEALGPVRIRYVARQELLRAIREPNVAMPLFRFLAQRLRGAFDTIEQLSRHRAMPRVAAALLALVQGTDIQFLALPQSSKAFAKALGLAPATLSRALAQLVEEGILHRLGARRYQVMKRRELSRLAKGEENAVR